MTLRKYKECGKAVSNKAKTCVDCGAPIAQKSSLAESVAVLLFIGFVVFAAVKSVAIMASPSRTAPAPSHAYAQPVAQQTAQIRPRSTAEKSTTWYVIDERVAERLAPSVNAAITNHVYKGQAVEAFDVKDGWTRVSPFYNALVEGHSGQVARWIETGSLSTHAPASSLELGIVNDPRIQLTKKLGNGLDERDVRILHAAASYFLEHGHARHVVDGDKSIHRTGYYYLNFDEPQNHFFRPSDIPNLEGRIAAMKM